MSNILLTAVWSRSRSKGSTRLVLLSLADQANDEGECWPSIGSVARRCLLSDRSVQDHIEKLIEMGELERAERAGRSAVFRVIPVPDGVQDSAPPADQGGCRMPQGCEARPSRLVKPWAAQRRPR